MEPTRITTHDATLADGSPATVFEWPMRIHHGGQVSLAYTAWILAAPVTEGLTERDGALFRANGERVTLSA